MTPTDRPIPEPEFPDPDDKDWTWVLNEQCPECGYLAANEPAARIGVSLLTPIATLREALTRPDATVRPDPVVWSPLEYACHVRDVCSIFHQRLNLILDEDDPLFENWDQDETAWLERYWEQQPEVVSGELEAAALALAAAINGVSPEQWGRPGVRSNGSVFTAETLCQYMLHDLVHHAHDVTAGRP